MLTSGDYRRVCGALIVTGVVVVVWLLGGWQLFNDCVAVTGAACL
mgnify:CR=1|jgi:hypothetical protein